MRSCEMCILASGGALFSPLDARGSAPPQSHVHGDARRSEDEQ